MLSFIAIVLPCSLPSGAPEMAHLQYLVHTYYYWKLLFYLSHFTILHSLWSFYNRAVMLTAHTTAGTLLPTDLYINVISHVTTCQKFYTQ